MHYLMCGVKNCRYRHHRRLPKNISLYMLPRDAPLEMKNSWRQVCKGRLIACSEHFDEDDFLMPRVHPGAASSVHGMAKPLKHFGQLEMGYTWEHTEIYLYFLIFYCSCSEDQKPNE